MSSISAIQNESNYFFFKFISTGTSYIPSFNIRSGEISSATANDNILEVSPIYDSFSIERETDISELIDFKYELIKPLKVKLKREGFEIIGEIPELNIYAFGDSDFEVLREINKEVTELFEELSTLSDNQLGSRPKKWKVVLSEYLKKNND